MKVCFVGIGSIARRHIKNLCDICRKQGITIEIDALRRPSSRQANILDIIENVYTDIDVVPRDYDVIFLTNPTEYHADMLMALHEHAKNFFIEKPVTSLRTIKNLDRIPFRKDSVYYVACPLRYSNVIQYLKKEINVRTVNAVRCICSSYLPEWRPKSDYRDTYSAHRNLGGGVDIDLIHEWDYLTYLFGMPTSIKSFSGKVSKLDIDSPDYAIYIAQYDDNMILELHLDYFGRKSIRTVEIYTDDDTIRGDLIGGTVEYLKSGKCVCLNSERDDYQKKELEYFLGLISSGNGIYNDIRKAVCVLKLTQGIID